MNSEELIAEHLKRLKKPDLDQDTFDELIEKVKVLRSLTQGK